MYDIGDIRIRYSIQTPGPILCICNFLSRAAPFTIQSYSYIDYTVRKGKAGKGIHVHRHDHKDKEREQVSSSSPSRTSSLRASRVICHFANVITLTLLFPYPGIQTSIDNEIAAANSTSAQQHLWGKGLQRGHYDNANHPPSPHPLAHGVLLFSPSHYRSIRSCMHLRDASHSCCCSVWCGCLISIQFRSSRIWFVYFARSQGL